jgi:hypothetical protein
MSNLDLRHAAGEFLSKLAQQPHAAQCETENYTNSSPCDCGLDALKIEATTVIADLLDAMGPE